jgi:hypothetical protein
MHTCSRAGTARSARIRATARPSARSASVKTRAGRTVFYTTRAKLRGGAGTAQRPKRRTAAGPAPRPCSSEHTTKLRCRAICPLQADRHGRAHKTRPGGAPNSACTVPCGYRTTGPRMIAAFSASVAPSGRASSSICTLSGGAATAMVHGAKGGMTRPRGAVAGHAVASFARSASICATKRGNSTGLV